MYTKERGFALAQLASASAQSKNKDNISQMKVSAEICPLCEGTGWKTVSQNGDRRVTRCDCRLKARSQTLLEAARIPKRYEHCELSSFTTDFPGAHASLALAHISATKFAQEYDPQDGTGLLLIGKIGTGKTHLGVGILKELILTRGVVWDTVSLILNTRYNHNRTTIITTNFDDQPPAGIIPSTRAAAREETLGDRIGERMRSRLHEMCRIIKLDGLDFRQKFRSANFR
jgi:DNA replication protein DnaC